MLAYAKNQALGFEIPYLDSGVTRRYLPDFLVRLDDGGDEPLNLVLEVKGIKDESDKAKARRRAISGSPASTRSAALAAGPSPNSATGP